MNYQLTEGQEAAINGGDASMADRVRRIVREQARAVANNRGVDVEVVFADGVVLEVVSPTDQECEVES